jgi:uncharacterized membrane protein YdjX (TVP38/TMEM64 family)
MRLAWEMDFVKMCLSRHWILSGLLIAAGLVTAWVLRHSLSVFLMWIGDRQAVADSMQQFGAWGPGVLFLLMVLQAFLAVIPGHALMLAGGYVFGFPLSLAIMFSSTVLARQIAFWIARHLGRPVVYRLAFPNTILRWEKLASRQGILFFFLTLVLPIFPSDLMCYVAGYNFGLPLLHRQPAGTVGSRRPLDPDRFTRPADARCLLGSNHALLGSPVWRLVSIDPPTRTFLACAE